MALRVHPCTTSEHVLATRIKTITVRHDAIFLLAVARDYLDTVMAVLVVIAAFLLTTLPSTMV